MVGANFVTKICNPNRYSVSKIFPRWGWGRPQMVSGEPAHPNMLFTVPPMVYRAAPDNPLKDRERQRTINPPGRAGQGIAGHGRGWQGMAGRLAASAFLRYGIFFRSVHFYC